MVCISVPTAMLIAGGVGAVGSVASAAIGAGAAKEAAATQAEAAKTAAGAQKEMFETVRGGLAPYMTAGLKGLEGVEGLLGLGGEDPAKMMEYLAATPGYQFTREQGLMATQNAYAAKGLGTSGAALKGAAEYATGLASSTYQQQIANMFNLAGLGENAAAMTGNFGMQSQQAINNALMGGASATAAGTIGAANAWGAGISGLGGALGNTATMLALSQAGMFGTPAGGAAGTTGGGFAPGSWYDTMYRNSLTGR